MKMKKAQYNIRIDTEVWDRFQELYPRQASPMIEQYLNEIIKTDTNEIESREVLIAKLKEAEEKKRQLENKERALQSQINSYDQQNEKRKELLESDRAIKKKNDYIKLSPDIRAEFSNICESLNKNKIKDFGFPIIPFDFYEKINDKIISDLLRIAEDYNYFELVRDIKNFERLWRNKNQEGYL